MKRLSDRLRISVKLGPIEDEKQDASKSRDRLLTNRSGNWTSDRPKMMKNHDFTANFFIV